MAHWNRGTVTVEHVYWFRCAQCTGEWHHAARTQAEAIEEARFHGWSKTIAQGWICPSCAARQQGGEEE